MTLITSVQTATSPIHNALVIRRGTSASIEFIFWCGTSVNYLRGTSVKKLNSVLTIVLLLFFIFYVSYISTKYSDFVQIKIFSDFQNIDYNRMITVV